MFLKCFPFSLKIIERSVTVVIALFFAQFPLFFNQYLHELQGHIHEIHYQITLLEKNAQVSNKTLVELLTKFKKNSDLDIQYQGIFIENLLNRYRVLKEAFIRLKKAHFFNKPLLFSLFFEKTIAKNTWENFQPGVPLFLEGAGYGLIGIILSYFSLSLLSYPFKKFSLK